MEIALTDEQNAIDESVRRICADFSDDYWTECDTEGRFPEEYYRAMADAGFLGITMPEDVGGSGLGVTEAAVMMHAATQSNGGYSAASAIHINLFGPHSIVVHGSDEQKQRFLPPLIRGEEKACFGVTEPDAGLDTTSLKTFARKVDGGYRITGRKIWTSTGQVAHKILILARTQAKEDSRRPTDGLSLFFTDLDRTKIEVRRIPKMGRNAVDSNAVFIDDLFVPDEDRIGEEGRGFHYILDSLNPERILVASEAIGVGRPIGQNQAIQHPLAQCWIQLESAWWMTMRAAWLYDSGESCGAEANAAKFLGGQAAFDTATRAVITHGGMGYAREYQVERLFRESILPRFTPVTEELILSFIAERVLDQPKSY